VDLAIDHLEGDAALGFVARVGASSAVAEASAAGAAAGAGVAAGSVVAPSAGAAGGVSACGAAGCWPQAARPRGMAANSEVWIRRMESLPG
jgi:hypothetical protein